MTDSYELFDHTADLGVRVRASTRAGLVAPAGAGLYAAIGTVATAGPPTRCALEINGRDAAELLRDYLAELLRRFERDRTCLLAVEVREFSDACLNVRGQAVAIDPARSVLEREVKAVTYHELAVREVPGGWEAIYIVDI